MVGNVRFMDGRRKTVKASEEETRQSVKASEEENRSSIASEGKLSIACIPVFAFRLLNSAGS